MRKSWENIFSALAFGDGKRRKGIKPRKRRTLTCEPLERRELLSVAGQQYEWVGPGRQFSGRQQLEAEQFHRHRARPVRHGRLPGRQRQRHERGELHRCGNRLREPWAGPFVNARKPPVHQQFQRGG